MPALATLRLSRPALASFAAMGVLWGTFAADLPDIKTKLMLDEQRLGLLLFMTPAAAILAMMAAPWLGRHLGRLALPVTTLAMVLTFVLPGQVAVWWLFPLAMLGCGAGTGAVDVLMNARVAALEQTSGQPLMNLCFAAYSFGYAGGAILTGALRSGGAGPAVVMLTMAALAGLVGLATVEADGRIDGLQRQKGVAAGLGMVPVIGGAIILIAFLTENAAENWSALHIEETLHGSPAHGALGPAVLALTMAVARLGGQGLAQRVAPVRLILGGALVSAVGALVVAGAASPAWAYAGFIVMGMGSSVISPTAFSLVASLAEPAARARAVARATMLGYFGYFIGPPAVGFVAGAFGLRAAFAVTAAVLMVVWLLAPRLARRS